MYVDDDVFGRLRTLNIGRCVQLRNLYAGAEVTPPDSPANIGSYVHAGVVYEGAGSLGLARWLAWMRAATLQ